MKLISWNVNGLRSIFGKGFAEILSREKPDLLCLQETKVLRDQLSEEHTNPAGYALELHPAKRRGYSGVALYRKHSFPQAQSLQAGLGEARFDDEGRFLIGEFKDFSLYNIYFPSGSSGEERQAFKYEFLDFMYAHFSGMSEQQRGRCIICGDFNICHKEIDIHHPKVASQRELSGFLPEERAWMDRFCELGFVDSFRHVHGAVESRYSWWSFRANSRAKNLGWRIDYIFVGPALASKLRKADIHDCVMGSDHCPVSIELEL